MTAGNYPKAWLSTEPGQLHGGDQTDVDLAVVNGKIVVTPATKSAQHLKDLLSRVTKRNLHGEVDTGAAVGKETW